MKEEDAKKKWCPLVRTAPMLGTVNYWSNRPGDAATAYNCVGSACMLWRWSKTHPNVTKNDMEAGAPLQTDGYCGLAGGEQ